MSSYNKQNFSKSNLSSLSAFSSGNQQGFNTQMQNQSKANFNTKPVQDRSLNYPQNQETSTFRVNPLAFKSLEQIDVDKLEDDFAKGIQRKKIEQDREKREVQKLYEESEEIKELRNKISLAKLNQERGKQVYENQTRRLQKIVQDAEVDEMVLNKLDEDRNRQREEEIRKKIDNLNSKEVILKQMKDREQLRQQAREEYLRDKMLVDNIVDRIIKEDTDSLNEAKRKKELAKTFMTEAYQDKENRLRQQKEEERLQKEKEKQYFEDVAKRDKDYKEKQEAKQNEKDRIFEKLKEEAARKQAEKEYWENVRNELYWEETERKEKIKELENQEKKQRQKEEMLRAAIEHMNVKGERKREEEKMESEFKKRLMEKYAEDERLEQYNAIRRKQKEMDYKYEVKYILNIRLKNNGKKSWLSSIFNVNRN